MIFNQDNSDLISAISDAESSIAIVANGDTHIAILSGNYVYIKNHGTLSTGLYKAIANIPLNGALTISNVSPADYGGLNQITSIAHGGTGANNGAEGLRNLGMCTGALAGTDAGGQGTYLSHAASDHAVFLFGKFGVNPLAFVLVTNSGTASIASLISTTPSNLIPTVSVENGKTKIVVPSWEILRYISLYASSYFE